MIKLLGRKTSGNVQKVLFLLEELRIPYTREDYGRQFDNTQTDAYRTLNPNTKVPTLIDGDLVIWESNTILRYLAASIRAALAGVDAGRQDAGRALDGLAARVRSMRPIVAVFKDAKNPPAERAADFAEQAKTSSSSSRSSTAISPKRVVRARPVHAGRDLARPDRQALPRIPDRAPSPAGAGEMAGRDRCRPAFQVAIGAKPSLSASAA